MGVVAVIGGVSVITNLVNGFPLDYTSMIGTLQGIVASGARGWRDGLDSHECHKGQTEHECGFGH